MVPTTPKQPSSSSTHSFLDNAKKNFSIDIDDEENLGLEHFADFFDEDDEDDNDKVHEDDNDGYVDDTVELNNLTNSPRQQKEKKSSKLMPNEEPHHKQLHPWLKSKRAEPTQKKAHLDLSTFMETNSVKHEHKMVISTPTPLFPICY